MGQTTSEPTRLAVRLGSADNGVVVATQLRVVPIALVLTALHVGLSWWRLARSWWWQDDLNLLATAAGDRNLLGLLFSDYNGHLVPGSYLAAWVVDRVSPLSWGIGAGVVLVIVLATDLALLAALVRMFGDRPAILLPFALWCSSSLTLTSVVWWAAAMQWMPTCLALALALYFHVRYMERPNPRDLALSAGSVALGLFFFEKALVIPVVLALLTVLYFVDGPLLVRPWRGVRRHVPYWLAHAAVAGGYLALYLNRAKITTGGSEEAAGQGGALVRNMILETYVPGLFGGPLNWYATPGTSLGSWSNPPGWLLWLSVLVAAAVVLGSIVLVRGGWRPWVVLALFLAFSVALVLRTRLGFVGAFIGRDHRYLTDAALLGVVCIALAWIPLRDGLDRALPPALPDAARARVRPGRRARLGRTAAGWAAHRRPQLVLAGGLAVVLVSVLGAVSGDRFMRSWEANPAPTYFTNLRDDLALAEPKPAFVFDQEVPPLIMSPNFGPARMLSGALAVLGDGDRPRIGTSAPEFRVVAADGHLRKGAVDGQQQTPPAGTPPPCSKARQPARGVTFKMATYPPEWVWKAEIAYLSSADTKAMVRYGDGPKVPVRLIKGVNTIFVEVRGGGPGVSITDLDRGATVCVGAVRVGNPVAAPS